MTDKKVSALTDGTTANATDRIPVARSPFGSGDNAYITPAYLDTYMASTTKTLSNKTLAAPTLTGTVTLTGGTVNGTVLDISQTWGGTGTYTGIKYVVTDSGPANASSLLLDVQVAGSSKFAVRKDGNYLYLGTASPGTSNYTIYQDNTSLIFQPGSGTSSGCIHLSPNGASNWGLLACYATNSQVRIGSNGSFGFTSGATTASLDVILTRDAANTLALRNSTNAQTFRTYYRYDDASNYAFGYMEAGVTANTLILGSNKVGSPAQALTKLQINVDGTSKADYGVSSASQWTFAGTTNVGALNIGAAGYLVWISRGSINANADGVYAWMNAAGNDFGRLQFGGTTSSFPALKRNGASLDLRLADDSGYANLAVQGLTCSQGVAIGSSHTVGWNSNGSYLFGNATTGANTGTMRLVASGGTSCLNFGGDTSSFPSLKRSSTALHARLADDSAYAPFSAELVTVAAGTATPAGGSTAGRLLMGTTAGFGVYYGSGAPTVSAAQGSIYLRSDGSSTSTRLYVNTDGSTTWTAVTTAA